MLITEVSRLIDGLQLLQSRGATGIIASEGSVTVVGAGFMTSAERMHLDRLGFIFRESPPSWEIYL